MLASVFAKGLRDARRGLAWWSAGLVGLVALMLAVWPSIRDNPAIAKLHEDYPEALQGFVSFGGAFDFGTPAGYLGAELFSLMVPILLIIAAVGAGAGTVAGEEERGTLDLLMANPVSRRRVVLEKSAAVATEVIGLGAVLLVALLVGVPLADMEISAAHTAAAVLDAVILALVFGAVALVVGAATGRRARAIGVASAAAVAAYVVNGLAPLVDAVDAVRGLSPFYHYVAGDPLRQGLDWHVAVLAGLAVAVAALAPLLFERRDLRS